MSSITDTLRQKLYKTLTFSTSDGIPIASLCVAMYVNKGSLANTQER